MDDLISRAEAIDAAKDWYNGLIVGSFKGLEKRLQAVPTIEERKSGYWKKVHGYATPGGDPVWACSECGKGIHVYGIEHSSYGKDVADGQWVACPNCGVEMLREIWTK